MTDPLLDRFDEFFAAVHDGHDPFPWQRRLARRVAEGDWPLALALPTASGKTACIDIAVFALACQAAWPKDKPRTASRRIFYTVDRRVIVDEAFDHAVSVARKLNEAERGILRDVAQRLLELMPPGDGGKPLACFQLRGGVYRDDAWARTPTSRLLFRGYGLRAGYAWPVHAGLAANDSLIILDEAHCANPFRQTLTSIARYRACAEKPLSNPFAVVLMSATPPTDIAATDMERLDAEDLAHGKLGPRIKAQKPTRLIEVRNAKGNEALERLAKEIAKQVLALADGEAKAIGIIVNRVAAAKMIYGLLADKHNCEAVLLTGRMRPIDRDETMRHWKEKLTAREGRPKLDRSLFVVATQCLEVGANLDFEGLVTECASLDALRQRFGRLNRLGLRTSAPGIIVIRADQANPKEDDPIYGSALPETWKWLQGQAANGEIDMGIASLDQMVGEAVQADPGLLKRLNAPAPDAPVMLPAYVDCWVQTSPVPCPDPDVSLFLHGPDRGAPEVQVVWRADLDPAAPNRAAWASALDLCPPAAAECMPVPLHAFRNWWNGDDASLSTMCDVEGGLSIEKEVTGKGPPRHALRWLGLDDSKLVQDAIGFQPGDTIVLPASVGGWNVLGHVPGAPEGDFGIDRGDEANALSRSKAVLRLHPALLDKWPASTSRTRLSQIAEAEEMPEDACELRDLLRSCCEAGGCPAAVRPIVQALACDHRLQFYRHPCPAQDLGSGRVRHGLVLLGSRRLPRTGYESDTFTHEDDMASATVRVLLTDHCRGMAGLAEQFAEKCGFPSETVRAVVRAAQCHDFGKADPRFQAWLHGAATWLITVGQPLAKSDRWQSSLARETARRKAGYPQGGRHELLSVRLIEKRARPVAGGRRPQPCATPCRRPPRPMSPIRPRGR